MLENLVGSQIFNALSDRSYEVRFNASYEASNLIRKSFSTGSISYAEVINGVYRDLLCRSNASSRKGGLTFLGCLSVGTSVSSDSALAVRLLKEASRLLDDDDPSVRFTACECLYNATGSTVVSRDVFQILFDSLCKIEGDPEIQASAASFDRVLRDVVSTMKPVNLADVEVFPVVESRIFYPHNHVKQLSIVWLKFLRVSSPQIFSSRLNSILPALISTLSHSSCTDIEVSVDSFILQVLSDIESGLLRLSCETTDQLSNAMCKYARFQSTLNMRSRAFVFQFLRVLSNAMVAAQVCGDALTVVLACLFDPHISEDVRSAAMQANLAMRTNTSFIQRVNESGNTEVRDLLINAARSSSTPLAPVIGWIQFLRPLSLGLSPYDYLNLSRALWTRGENPSVPEIESVLGAMISEFGDDIEAMASDISRVLSNASDDAFCDMIWTYIQSQHEGVLADLVKRVGFALKDVEEGSNSILLTVCNVLIRSEITTVHSLSRDTNFMKHLSRLCPMGFIMVCVYSDQLVDARDTMSGWDRVSFSHKELAVFVEFLESRKMHNLRKSLVTTDGRMLSELLLNVAIMSHPDSLSYQWITSRIQLASFSRN